MSITTTDVNYLFDELWPMMHGSPHHKQNCIAQFSAVSAYFKKHGKNFDELLNSLDSLDGIGLTVASGLIWSAYRHEAVPFDKYTMTYALYEGVLRTHRISAGKYSKCSKEVIAYCSKFVFHEEDGTERPYEVEDFVREAMDSCLESPTKYPQLQESA